MQDQGTGGGMAVGAVAGRVLTRPYHQPQTTTLILD